MMLAVLARVGGVAGQKDNDWGGTRIFFLVEFKDNS
jgi:hypothetical protein